MGSKWDRGVRQFFHLSSRDVMYPLRSRSKTRNSRMIRSSRLMREIFFSTSERNSSKSTAPLKLWSTSYRDNA